MRLFSFLKVNQKLSRSRLTGLHKKIWQPIQCWWKQIKADSVSPEYKRWRHRFILKRLHLIIWVAIVVELIIEWVNKTIFIPSYNPSSREYDFYQQNFRLINGITMISFLALLFTFVLLKVSLVRRYPILIQLWLTFILLLVPQIDNIIFFGQIELNGYGWITFFSAVSILLPVKWGSHCLCQGIVLGHFGINYLVFGLRNSFVENEIEYFAAVFVTVIVCAIANLGVFLYERILQQEFELRRQLRLFLYTVSHDLRNPVLGKMFLLKTLLNSSAEQVLVSQEILTEMLNSSDRQLKLIDSLLEAHNTENQGIVLRTRPVKLDALIESVVMEMQPLLERQKATVTQEIQAKLPLVNIDSLQIRRVYENLMANALEHNPPGLHLTLKVGLRNDILLNRQHKIASHRWVYCTVSDNGEGIPPQQSSKLFDLYTRASSTKQSLNVGLGLYISRQIITAHGGEIGVDSSSQGASFWFTLPIYKL